MDDWEHARLRLEYGLTTLRALGATVDGEVGDANPAKAITDVLKRKSFDEVVLSTLPKGISRWLGQTSSTDPAPFPHPSDGDQRPKRFQLVSRRDRRVLLRTVMLDRLVG